MKRNVVQPLPPRRNRGSRVDLTHAQIRIIYFYRCGCLDDELLSRARIWQILKLAEAKLARACRREGIKFQDFQKESA